MFAECHIQDGVSFLLFHHCYSPIFSKMQEEIYASFFTVNNFFRQLSATMTPSTIRRIATMNCRPSTRKVACPAAMFLISAIVFWIKCGKGNCQHREHRDIQCPACSARLSLRRRQVRSVRVQPKAGLQNQTEAIHCYNRQVSADSQRIR